MAIPSIVAASRSLQKLECKTLARVAKIFGERAAASPRDGVRSGVLLRSGRRSAELQFFRRQCSQDCREFNTEDGPAFLPVVRKNFAAVFLDDTEADAEAQACALADRLGRIK